LAVEGFLWLSDQLNWFAFNHHKGWTALIAVAAVGVTMLLLALWFAASLLFRWRFQFSIRSLLAAVVVVAIPCSWLATEMEEAKEQWKAADAIEDLDGTVKWDEPAASRWLRNLLGDYYFSSVVKVDFFSAPADDAAMAHVEKLSRLEDLDVRGTRVTDAGLKYLKKLNQLRVLGLNVTRVTDAGMEHLKELRHLEWLRLDDTHVTDAGLKYLAGLSQLRLLGLNRTLVGDAGLEHIKALAKLDTLDLGETRVTDAGLQHVTGLKQLKSLELSGTRVTTAGVKTLHRALPECDIQPSW
jgi:Leucine-rich repeat (LRR) protein